MADISVDVATFDVNVIDGAYIISSVDVIDVADIFPVYTPPVLTLRS